jgi:hypothetical protein
MKKDIVKIKRHYVNCGCEDMCDCPGYDYSVQVNGLGGHGSGQWVLDKDKGEVLYFRTIFGEFLAQDHEAAVKELKCRLSAFKNVEVSDHTL